MLFCDFTYGGGLKCGGGGPPRPFGANPRPRPLHMHYIIRTAYPCISLLHRPQGKLRTEIGVGGQGPMCATSTYMYTVLYLHN